MKLAPRLQRSNVIRLRQKTYTLQMVTSFRFFTSRTDVLENRTLTPLLENQQIGAGDSSDSFDVENLVESRLYSVNPPIKKIKAKATFKPVTHSRAKYILEEDVLIDKEL